MSPIVLLLVLCVYQCDQAISQAIVAVNDLATTGLNIPICIPVLANDFSSSGMSFSSINNSTSGFVYQNYPPFHLANESMIVFETENYQEINYRSNTGDYETAADATTWQTVNFYDDASGGLAMRNWPASSVNTGNNKYGVALRYDLVFLTPGIYKVWVRGRPCTGCNTTIPGATCDGCASNGNADDSLHFLQRNSTGLFFTSNGNQIGGMNTPWIWKGFNVPAAALVITSDDITWPPTPKQIYFAEDEDGAVIDRAVITINTGLNIATAYGSTSATGDPASPYINCSANELLYFPSYGFAGIDSFQYTITNGVQSSTATVTIYVAVPPPSPSPSISPTTTPSRTPSVTPSPSVTPTRSVTPSVSPTASVTPTTSITPTPSRTPSVSITPTRTPSPSVTPTVTPTRTATPTRTPSITPSSTSSPSTGASPSATSSVTPSISVSPSVTPSPSITPTSSPSSTPSVTPTPSITPSRTPSRTPSSSRTPSTSVTPTVTPTTTPTSSVTPSSTPSPSPTASISPSATPSPIHKPHESSSESDGSSLGVAIGLGVGLPLCAAGAGTVAFIAIRRRKKDDPEESVSLMAFPVIPEPSDEKLAKFEEILFEEGYRLVKAITKYTQITEADKIASWLTTDFEFNGLTVDLIKSLISREVKLANHAGSLMRANSMASKMMKCLSGLIAKKYLKFLFLDIIEQIMKNPTEGGCSFEVDPAKVPQNETLEGNQKKLETMCSKFLRRIFDNADKAPVEFRQICNALQKRVSIKFPESSQTSVGGFLFLRVYCPAIVAPSGFGIVPQAPGGAAQRGLTLIAKTLQNVANNVTFGNKEEFMIWLNPFINTNLSACQDYFDEMATIPPDGNEGLVDLEQRKITPEKREKALKDLYKHVKILYPKMKDKYAGKDFFEKFYQIAKEDLELAETNKQQIQAQQPTPTPAPQTNAEDV